jgi:hypothetical protein
MLTDGYELICSLFGDLRSSFGLSSMDDGDVKRYCDHHTPDEALSAASRSTKLEAEAGKDRAIDG